MKRGLPSMKGLSHYYQTTHFRLSHAVSIPKSCLPSDTSAMGTSSGSVLHLDCEFMLSEGKDGGAGLFFIVFKVIEESLG